MLKRRRAAPILRPDFTPFVSVALLLIVFFVWVKQLQRPNTLVCPTPFRCKCDQESLRSITTLFLLAHNRVGILRLTASTDTAVFMETSYHTGKLQRLLQWPAGSDRLALIVIKPSAQATLGNLVHVLNELRRCRNDRYLLNDCIRPDEANLLAYYNTLKTTDLNCGTLVVLFQLYEPYHFGVAQ